MKKILLFVLILLWASSIFAETNSYKQNESSSNISILNTNTLPKFSIEYNLPFLEQIQRGSDYSLSTFLSALTVKFRIKNNLYYRIKLLPVYKDGYVLDSNPRLHTDFSIGFSMNNDLIRFKDFPKINYFKIFYGVGSKVGYHYIKNDFVDYGKIINESSIVNLNLIFGLHFQIVKNLYIAIENQFGINFDYSFIRSIYIDSSSFLSYNETSHIFCEFDTTQIKAIFYF